MQNKSHIDEGNGTKMCQVSSLKPWTYFGASVTKSLSDKATDDNHLSESYRDSDSFNSDEEDSEEERLYKEKVRLKFLSCFLNKKNESFYKLPISLLVETDLATIF